MVEKRKLELMALEGNFNAFLEIERLENGDMYVTMVGQDTDGIPRSLSAQIPNPINGGGNLDDYKTLTRIYEVLKKIKK